MQVAFKTTANQLVVLDLNDDGDDDDDDAQNNHQTQVEQRRFNP